MKFYLIAILVVALAIGSESVSLVKREAPAEIEEIAKYFEDVVDTMASVELKTFSDFEDQIKPLASAASVQAQVAPLGDMVQSQFEKMIKFVAKKTKDILPPQ